VTQIPAKRYKERVTESIRAPIGASSRRARIFLSFKYGVYLLLAVNLVLFFSEEFAGFAIAFGGGATAGDVVEAFSATIDTAAWIVLLMLFELETYLLPDRWVGEHARLLHAIRIFCYVFIVWAFYGYCAYLAFLLDARPLDVVGGLCELVGQSKSFIVDLDEYVSIDAGNCGSLATTADLYALGSSPVVADGAAVASLRPLAWTDVINSGTWLLVVLLLEIDLRLEESGRLVGGFFRASYAAKVVLYSVLLVAAVYWGVRGAVLDFWDAFLWLLAFVFIELNVLGEALTESRPE